MKKILKTAAVCASVVFLTGANACAISAERYCAIDAGSGRILSAKNETERAPMASTTKIMTALCALENGDEESVVTVSESASGVEGSSIYLEKGETIPLENLLFGLMLESGNDAAAAVAEHISGSVEKFTELMNDTARKIGAYNTSFTNPHGLPDENHFTTALDLAKITAYALENPTFAEIVATKTKNIPWAGRNYDRKLVNHNKLLSMYDGCIGVKTGYTRAAGRCLASAVEKSGMRVVCVTLNAPDDWNDHKIVYDEIFSEFSPHLVKRASEAAAYADIENGEVERVALICKNDAYIPIRQNEAEKLEISTEIFEGICAPIEKGEVLGRLIVLTDGSPCGSFPLCAEHDVALKKVVFRPNSESLGLYLKKFLYTWVHCFDR